MGASPEVNPSEPEVDELADALSGKSSVGEVKDTPEPEPDKKEPEPTKPVSEPEKKEEPTVKSVPEPDKFQSVEEQNRELRQILRSQKRDLSIMQAKLSRLEKRSAEATKKVEEGVTEEEDAIFGSPKKAAEPAPAKEEPLSPVEEIQSELVAIARAKGPILDTLLETMELNSNFKDVREVCSQSNFDDIFEAIGDAVAAKEGKDASIAALEAEAAVWKMPNPYKYMYGLIKQYHPKYSGRQPDTKVDKPKDDKDSAKKPVDAPSSLASVPGKGAPANAWTSARIDEMDELELDKVPPEIYDKYLRGELD